MRRRAPVGKIAKTNWSTVACERGASTPSRAHASLKPTVTTDLFSPDGHRARVLDASDADDRDLLARLRADPRVDVIDTVDQQTRSLAGLMGTAPATTDTEPPRWAYYPWRRTLVAVLGPGAFRRVRLDRNRNLITAADQQRLGALRIGVVGLSVGHAVAYTVAAQGLCGSLRLTDFDALELTNLNRVPATVFDLSVNKAVVAARRIAELDPYLPVEVTTGGLTPETIDDFLAGLDIVVEECDSLDIKVLVREAARARRLPVLMATSDRVMVDVERFDIDPDRPVLHGLLGDVDGAALANLSSPDKVPYVLRVIDARGLSARGAASLIEIGHTLSTWPQLAGDVAACAGAVAEAIRRIGLRQHLPSGRVFLDIESALGELTDVAAQPFSPPSTQVAPEPHGSRRPTRAAEHVAAAAIRAPSGGNAQPWHVALSDETVTIELAPAYTATMDVGLRASAVAVGAAVFNARVAAAAHGVLGPVTISERGDRAPLCAVLALGRDDHSSLARMYQPMLDRETNRHRGTAAPLDDATAALLAATAAKEGASLRLLTDPDQIRACARIFGESDRIRYLTPNLHADMVAELRWPGDAASDSGIDVESLELDTAQWALTDILRRSDVMAALSASGGGAALGAHTCERVAASSAIAAVCVRGHTLRDYARGGSAMEATWVVAQEHGIAVQPISPVFLYAHDADELARLSSLHADELAELRREFLDLVGLGPEDSAALVFRLFQGPRPSVRSRRRPLGAGRGETAHAGAESSCR